MDRRKVLEELQKATGLQLQVTKQQDQTDEEITTSLQELLSGYQVCYQDDSCIQKLLKGEEGLSSLMKKNPHIRYLNQCFHICMLLDYTGQPINEIPQAITKLIGSWKKGIIVEESPVMILIFDESPINIQSIEDVLSVIEDFFHSELLCKVTIGVSDCFYGLEKLAQAQKEALISLQACKVFTPSLSASLYSQLGLEPWIMKMTKQDCKEYLSHFERLQENHHFPEELDHVASVFLQCNLNSSQAARQLYMHRNTLQHKLDKIMELTGFDIRKFQDASDYVIAKKIMQQKFSQK